MRHELGPHGSTPGGTSDPGAMAKGGAVQHLSVNVELALPCGGVAEAHGLGPVPTGQVLQLRFLDPPATIHAVHDPHLVRRPGDGAQQPLKPSLRFAVEAGVQQGGEGEGGIPQPTVAVVPVHRSPRFLRQAERRGGDNATRRQVGQRLEREQGPLHRFRPGSRLVEVVDPVFPPLHRRVLRPRRIDRFRNAGLGTTVLQHVVGALPRSEGEPRPQHVFILPQPGAAQHHQVGPDLAGEPVNRFLIPGRDLAVAEAERQAELDLDESVKNLGQVAVCEAISLINA